MFTYVYTYTRTNEKLDQCLTLTAHSIQWLFFFTQGVHAGISGDILISIFLRNTGFDLFLSVDFNYDL